MKPEKMKGKLTIKQEGAIKMEKFKHNYCKIRKDLAEKYAVWTSAGYMHGKLRGWRYKWSDDDTHFYIKFANKWVEAESIDFDFIKVGEE